MKTDTSRHKLESPQEPIPKKKKKEPIPTKPMVSIFRNHLIFILNHYIHFKD